MGVSGELMKYLVIIGATVILLSSLITILDSWASSYLYKRRRRNKFDFSIVLLTILIIIVSIAILWIMV